MATIESLRVKVLTYIGETEAHDDGAAIRYDIDSFIAAALGKLALVAPVHLLPVSDFLKATITKKSDGSGVVPLPNDFAKLVEFRLEGWSRSVTTPIYKSSAEYSRQANPITRGSVERPVVVLSIDGDCKQSLICYSIPVGVDPTISAAEYIPVLTVEKLPDKLVEALCWLVASEILAVANEAQASQYAGQQFEQEILIRYGNTKGNDK